MSRDGRILPEPTDDTERQVLGDIARHGWHVVLVREGVHEHERPGPWAADPTAQAAYEATFSYTVGLTYAFGHPEVVLVGGWQHAHAYLNVVGQMVEEGQRFTGGDTTDELLEGFTVRVGPVAEEPRRELLTWADWAVQRQPFDALQLILPDTAGRWPNDPNYHAFSQPLLG